MLENRLAEYDEDPGVCHGVEGVETERHEILFVPVYRADGIDEAGNLKDRKRKKGGGVLGWVTKMCLMYEKKLFNMTEPRSSFKHLHF